MSITTATWSKKEEKDYYQDPNINNMISKQHQVLYRKSAENSFHQPKDFRFSPDSGVKYTKEQAEKLKSREMKEIWMKNDEWRIMNE